MTDISVSSSVIITEIAVDMFVSAAMHAYVCFCCHVASVAMLISVAMFAG